MSEPHPSAVGEDRSDSHGDKPAPAGPVDPKPSSTVALLRDGPSGPETLLLLRPPSGFAPGMWVFPGGVVDDNDFRLHDSIPEVDARLAERMAIAEFAEVRAYLVAAIREAWEETGVLLGRVECSPADVVAFRTRVMGREIDFFDATTSLGFTASPSSIIYLTRWVTPPTLPRRYDTRFFAAKVPDGSDVVLEGGELLDARWMTPDEGIRRWEAGEMSMMLPTAHTLRQLAGFQSTGELLEVLGELPATAYLPADHRPSRTDLTDDTSR